MGHFYTLCKSRSSTLKPPLLRLCLFLTSILVPISLAAAPQATPQSPGQEDTKLNPQPAEPADAPVKKEPRQEETSQENKLGWQTIKNICATSAKSGPVPRVFAWAKSC
jgi:hypothetical protein